MSTPGLEPLPQKDLEVDDPSIQEIRRRLEETVTKFLVEFPDGQGSGPLFESYRSQLLLGLPAAQGTFPGKESLMAKLNRVFDGTMDLELKEGLGPLCSAARDLEDPRHIHGMATPGTPPGALKSSTPMFVPDPDDDPYADPLQGGPVDPLDPRRRRPRW